MDRSSPRGLFVVGLMAFSALGACHDEDPYGGITFEGEFGEPVPFEPHAGLVFIDVEVDGTGPRPFIVDTGAQYVLLEASFAHELGYTNMVNDVDELRIGDLVFSGVDGVPFDLAPIEETLDAPLDGIIGGSLLRYFTLIVDYQGSVIRLLDTEEEAAAVDSARVDEQLLTAPLDVDSGIPLSWASLESAEPAQFVIDTGASTVALFQSYYDTLDTGGRHILEGSEGLSAAGTFSVDMTRFCGVQVGEAHAPDVPVSIIGETALGDIRTVFPDLVGLVGFTFLRDFLTVFDYPEGQARFYQYTERPHVFEDEFVQAGVVLSKTEGGEVEVATVYPDSDAEEQGLEEGDRVLEVNGRNAEAMRLDELASALVGEIGDTVVLAIDRDGTPQELEILIEDLLPGCDG